MASAEAMRKVCAARVETINIMNAKVSRNLILFSLCPNSDFRAAAALPAAHSDELF